MTGRHNHHKGSSRSTRDDSRNSERERNRERRRSRSRSPMRRHSPKHNKDKSPERSSTSRERHWKEHDKYEDRSSPVWEPNTSSTVTWETSEDLETEVPAPPPPPRISKISIDLSKPKAPIKMNITGSLSKPTLVKKPTVASVFNDDSDDEDQPEEMPAEAKMRMRNIGRDTPTSAGPNSFGKTKQGFCDAKKVFEKNLKQALEMNEKPAIPKFPQTIYKIKGP